MSGVPLLPLGPNGLPNQLRERGFVDIVDRVDSDVAHVLPASLQQLLRILQLRAAKKAELKVVILGGWPRFTFFTG